MPEFNLCQVAARDLCMKSFWELISTLFFCRLIPPPPLCMTWLYHYWFTTSGHWPDEGTVICLGFFRAGHKGGGVVAWMWMQQQRQWSVHFKWDGVEVMQYMMSSMMSSMMSTVSVLTVLGRAVAPCVWCLKPHCAIFNEVLPGNRKRICMFL